MRYELKLQYESQTLTENDSNEERWSEKNCELLKEVF